MHIPCQTHRRQASHISFNLPFQRVSFAQMEEAAQLRSKPPCSRDDALAVLRRLRTAGHVAYFAGGCVRDILLGLAPKDFDVATDAPPQRVRELFFNTQAVGAVFGVILVRQGSSVIEVATFRREGDYEDGRHPTQVHFTSAREDAQRRDFSINGLFLDPLTDDVIDFVGGRDDLAAHRIRAIGTPAERFAEDHLRLLRAVRFAARFDFTIEAATASAMLEHAPLLKRISPERIADELRLMLTPQTRVKAWEMLWQFNLGQVIYRTLTKSPPAAFSAQGGIFRHVAPAEKISFGLALAAATLDVISHWQPVSDIRALFSKHTARHMEQAMRQSLKISNEESADMEESLEGVFLMLQDEPPRLALKKRFLARPTALGSWALLRALSAAGHQQGRVAALEPDLTALENTAYAPLPFVTGDDLVSAGLTPGPPFKRILDAVYDAQLEDQLRDRNEAIAMAMRLAAQ